ncbi:hypothetical protein FA454_14295 [Pseudomonas aeruginosa]|uniref:conserved plasmid protein n=1 Tax=Pseudomonas aeruginosa TaxID=287 RepID=UPI0008FB02B1|nr:conserved plasmid protein [Pseudomonas aeruginosa]MCO1686905.1 hypothetical protein [Pseudomonas aeruginosa]MCO1780320.1 hypothetical protein [Pseudomonas aeruginosa]MCO1790194.1 hypothetical protein [Pseudomonas aeruginosa]MCO1799166.1 hypothetical protein [Pseudomonas aeruginosa]MDV6504248.1 hypothetical protein [Pseudomonas aeruginosa]
MSTSACNTPSQPIDEPAWRAVCEAASVAARNGCGLSWDYYVELFSAAIDAQIDQLPEDQRAMALEMAQDWDYATPAQRQETRAWNAENGYCTHGINIDCCPLGCGSLDA